MNVFDGFEKVEGAPIRLRHGHALIAPVKERGTTASGLAFEKQDGIPTTLALVVAVSPFANGFAPVTPGDIIVRQPYAGEPVAALTLHDTHGLAPMERSARTWSIINIRDIEAVVGHVSP